MYVQVFGSMITKDSWVDDMCLETRQFRHSSAVSAERILVPMRFHLLLRTGSFCRYCEIEHRMGGKATSSLLIRFGGDCFVRIDTLY